MLFRSLGVLYSEGLTKPEPWPASERRENGDKITNKINIWWRVVGGKKVRRSGSY